MEVVETGQSDRRTGDGALECAAQHGRVQASPFFLADVDFHDVCDDDDDSGALFFCLYVSLVISGLRGASMPCCSEWQFCVRDPTADRGSLPLR